MSSRRVVFFGLCWSLEELEELVEDRREERRGAFLMEREDLLERPVVLTLILLPKLRPGVLPLLDFPRIFRPGVLPLGSFLDELKSGPRPVTVFSSFCTRDCNIVRGALQQGLWRFLFNLQFSIS